MSGSKALLDKLSDAIVAGNVHEARKFTERAVNEGLPAGRIFDRMMEAMRVVERRYKRKEYFTVDIAAASTAMREAFKVLEPHMKVKPANVAGKIVIGSLKGNIQGLGKDIVAGALRSAGFQVVDLGVNVAPEAFVESAIREKANVVAISVSVDETTTYLKDIVDNLRRRKMNHKVKTIIGGRAVNEQKRKQYGLDAYATDPWECVKKVRALLPSTHLKKPETRSPKYPSKNPSEHHLTYKKCRKS